MSIPPATAAWALFHSDRTCCVCRVRGQAVEAHWVKIADSDTIVPENVAVLCPACRQAGLEPAQLQARRNEWVSLVACERLRDLHSRASGRAPSLALATTLAEILRENEQYELLAQLYHAWGNAELRDKYVEKALAQRKSARAEISLRVLQGRLEEVASSLVEQEVERHQQNRDWRQLARLEVGLKRWPEAVQSYCRSLIEAIEHHDNYSAAAILREIAQQDLGKALLEMALRQAADCDDFWWEVRCLDELGWSDDLRDHVVNRQARVKQSGDLFLQLVLSRESGEDERVAEIQRSIAAELRTF